MTEVKDDFVFRSGRYAGKTYRFVTEVNPRYIDWVVENRPEMLREYKTNITVDTQGLTPREKFAMLMNPNGSIKPNNNFDNE